MVSEINKNKIKFIDLNKQNLGTTDTSYYKIT